MVSCPTIIALVWLMLTWVLCGYVAMCRFFFSNYQNINENDRGIILWLFVSPKPTKNSFIDNSNLFTPTLA